MAIRETPSTTGRLVGMRKAGDEVEGHIQHSRQGDWLKVLIDPDINGYMLINGAAVGLGTLLRPIAGAQEAHPPEVPMLLSPPPPPHPPPPPNIKHASKPQPPIEASTEPAAAGPVGYWQVVHQPRIAIRAEPTASGKVVSLLLKKGASIRVCNRHRETPLHFCARYK